MTDISDTVFNEETEDISTAYIIHLLINDITHRIQQFSHGRYQITLR